MSSTRSMPRTNATPSTGRPTDWSTMPSMTAPAPGTPAVPTEARVQVRMMVSCWGSARGIP